MSLRDDIVTLLKSRNYVSFVELSRLDGFDGNLSICAHVNHNIVFWHGLSQEAADILEELRLAKAYEFGPANVMTYVCDGTCLNLPLVKSKHAYKTPHWFPVVLNHPGTDKRDTGKRRRAGHA